MLEPIPALSAIPRLEPKRYAELKAMIAEHGQLVPVLRYGKNLVDGRERIQICAELGIECRYEDLDPGLDAVTACILLNLGRRHQDDDSRALSAAMLANMRVGRPGKSPRSRGFSIREASHMLQAAEGQTERAKAVLKKGAPELLEAVQRRDISLTTAAEIAQHAPDRQREIVRASASKAKGIALALARSRKTPHQSYGLRLSGADVIALRALAEEGRKSKDPKARAGVLVLQRLAPAVKRDAA